MKHVAHHPMPAGKVDEFAFESDQPPSGNLCLHGDTGMMVLNIGNGCFPFTQCLHHTPKHIGANLYPNPFEGFAALAIHFLI